MNKKFVTLLALLALMLTVEAGAESFTELYKKAKAGDVVAQLLQETRFQECCQMVEKSSGSR